MMVLKNLFVFLYLLVAVQISRAQGAGGAVSHGGGSVAMCKEANAAGLKEGFYSVEYVISFRNSKNPRWIALHKFQADESPIEAIKARFKETTPELANSLESFLAVYAKQVKGDEPPGTQDFLSDIYWRPSLDGLEALPTGLIETLPEGCRETFLAIHREENSDAHKKVIYNFWPEIMKSVERDPVNDSWLKTHEWLRDFVSDARTLQRINEYLHSEAFFDRNTTAYKVARDFESLGLGNFRHRSEDDLNRAREKWIDKRSRFITETIQDLRTNDKISTDSGMIGTREAGRMIAIIEYEERDTVTAFNVEEIIHMYVKAGNRELFNANGLKKDFPRGHVPLDVVNSKSSLPVIKWMNENRDNGYTNIDTPVDASSGKPNVAYAEAETIYNAIGRGDPVQDEVSEQKR